MRLAFGSLSALVAGVILLAPTVAAQRLTPAPAGATSPLSVPPAVLHIDDSTQGRRPLPRTYWVEGGIIGGIVMVGLLAAISVGAGGTCESDCGNGGQLLAGFLVAGGFGFGIGALIGGQFHKAPRDTTASR